jgi:hypothetical protein
MKRCPKCNRTFPDENQKFCTFDGGLLITAPAFDPNITIRATAVDMETYVEPSDDGATSRALPNVQSQPTQVQKPIDPNETMMASAPTAVFQRPTGPTNNATSADLSANAPRQTAAQSVPIGAVTASSAPRPQPQVSAPLPAKKKGSKLPLIIGVLVVVLLLGGGALAAVFFLVVKPRLGEFTAQPKTERPAPPVEQPSAAPAPATPAVVETKPPEDTFVPPADAVKFANSKDSLDGKLAEHYLDFYFYYPGAWQKDPSAGVAGASNFARVFQNVTDKGEEFTSQSVAVSWYNSNGTYDTDVSIFPSRVESLSAQLAKSLPSYKKVSEAPTLVNSLKAYDFHFTGVSKDPERGDLPYWGRAIFIPPGNENEKSGVAIIMLATARATDVKNEEDVGTKGDMQLILDSFRLGRKN